MVKKKKRKGHPGFSYACRRKGWTYADWERQVKALKKSKSVTNPYSVTNAICKRRGPPSRSRSRKTRK